MKVLVTGNAGFIGYHTAKRLLERGDTVIGLDVVDDYYDPALKEARLRELEQTARQTNAGYAFHRINLADLESVSECFSEHKPDRVINLAAQAGVRYSLENPHVYAEANLTGFTNILELCRHFEVEHLTYASTSSVYGANRNLPYRENGGADHPIQFYAATKRANELMAHAYSHLFNLPTTGLRFFTVYGPWGRPDMAVYKFTKNIFEEKPITVFNHGNHMRDFTYIDDLVEGIVRINDNAAEPDNRWDAASPDPSISNVPYRIYNIGNGVPVPLIEYIEAIEEAVGKEAIKELLPLQPGDVQDTEADVQALDNAIGYKPSTPVRDGVRRFVDWYREYHNL